MRIEHVALWVKDLEAMRRFYEHYFGARSGDKYHNPEKQFTSYFLSFHSGCRLELMHRPDVSERMNHATHTGLTHFAMSVDTEEQVRLLTEQLRRDGYVVLSEPRTTGDGYYESVIGDPEGNRVEITV
jgi:lactoylglutathione lyase